MYQSFVCFFYSYDSYVIDLISNHSYSCFTETIEERVMRVSNIMETTTLGKVLQKCLSEVNFMDCVKAYLSDFVHMVYHVTSQKEHGVKTTAYSCKFKQFNECKLIITFHSFSIVW